MSRNQTYIVVAGCLLGLCLVGVVVAGGVLFFVPRLSSMSAPTPFLNQVPDTTPLPNAQGNSLGDPNAPIHMEEFSDFQCPFCERFHHETAPSLVENYVKTGKVLFTYHSMGNWVSENIGGGNTESQDAAMAAYCAMDQNRFWEYHDLLFANVRGENVGSFSGDRLTTLAEQLGLDMHAFKDCLSSKKYEERTKEDKDTALSAGISGTPSFLLSYTVNGQTKTKLIEGAQPFDVFQQELDAILAELGQ